MKKKEGRPDWFKFWRRSCQQLDIEELSLEDRGIVFTNMMRYFAADDPELISMNPLQSMAFNVLKISIDESIEAYKDRAETNRLNGLKGGRPSKPKETEKTHLLFKNPQKAKKPEDRSKKIEGRNTEGKADRPDEGPPAILDDVYPWMKNMEEGRSHE